MIQVTRSPFVEQPNGDLVCTITIAREDRAKALFGHPIQLRETPGPAPADAPTVAKTVEPMAKSEFTVDIPSEPAAASEKPPAQTIGVSGQDQSTVLESADICAGWEHPCASHIFTIHAHTPFGRYAQEHAGASVNAWQSPMQVGMALLQHVVAGKDLMQARAAIEELMDRYAEWAKQRNLPVWPPAG